MSRVTNINIWNQFPILSSYKIKRKGETIRWNVHSVPLGFSEEGMASWYGPGFDGRKTSTGEIFYSRAQLSAAHRHLKLPCTLTVTNLDNGKTVDVRCNDRGPFAQVDRRIIDLSYKAARALGFGDWATRSGEARVSIKLKSLG